MTPSLLKKLFLYEKFRVHSPLMPDEVKERLQKEFERAGNQSTVDTMFSSYCYNGALQGNTFQMYRQPPLSFLHIPAVVSQGVVDSRNDGTCIDVKVRINPHRLLPAIVLFALSAIVLVVAGQVSQIATFTAFLLPLILVVGYVVALFTIQVFARDAERFFRRVLGRR